MDRTNCRSTPNKNQAVLQHLYLLPINHYEKMEQEEIHILTKYQPSTIHYNRTIYSRKVGSGQIVNRTNRQIIPTKTETVFQQLYFLPSTFYKRMKQEEVHLS
jgi:hypothetical protein